MSTWEDSHWIDYYDAEIVNVFAGGGSAWIDFRYIGLGHVGWRRFRVDSDGDLTRLTTIATEAKASRWAVMLRVTNAGEITAIQTR